MTYKKMTAEDFKARLKNGDYKDATGARRGVGKADLSDDEKEQCRRAIDKFFGAEPAPAAGKKPQKKVAKAPTNKKVSAKKAAASNGKTEKPNGVVKKGVRGRRPREEKSGSHQFSHGDNELLAKLHLAKERLGTITQAVDTMKRAKDAYPELDTRAGMTVAATAITEIMQGVHQSLSGTMPDLDPKVMEDLARTAPAAMGLPGHQSPVQVPVPQQTTGQTPAQDLSAVS